MGVLTRSPVENARLRSLDVEQQSVTAAIRELLDTTFGASNTWEPKKTGDVDWSKCKVVNRTRVCVGVEIQISARSELLYKDILHLKTWIVTGDIDLGIIIVPSDRLQSFLPGPMWTPSFSYAKTGD